MTCAGPCRRSGARPLDVDALASWAPGSPTVALGAMEDLWVGGCGCGCAGCDCAGSAAGGCGRGAAGDRAVGFDMGMVSGVQGTSYGVARAAPVVDAVRWRSGDGVAADGTNFEGGAPASGAVRVREEIATLHAALSFLGSNAETIDHAGPPDGISTRVEAVHTTWRASDLDVRARSGEPRGLDDGLHGLPELPVPAPTGVPARFRNGIWTRLDAEGGAAFSDVAEGGGYVWAASQSHGIYVLRPGSLSFERVSSVKSRRIAVLPDGSPIVIIQGSGLLLGNDEGTTWRKVPVVVDHGSGVKGVFDLSDVAVATYERFGVHLAELFVVTGQGKLLRFSGYRPGEWVFRQRATDVRLPNRVRAVRVAGTPAGRGDGSPAFGVWIVASDGDVYSGSGFGSLDPVFERVAIPVQAHDVGVDGERALAIVQGVPGPVRPGAARRQDAEGGSWFEMRGTGLAIAATREGSTWVVGADGAVYNWGGRSMGFWDGAGTRSRPKPGQSWCDFLTAGGLVRDPAALDREAHERFLQGGASTLMFAVNWDDVSDTWMALDPANLTAIQRKFIRDAFAQLGQTVTAGGERQALEVAQDAMLGGLVALAGRGFDAYLLLPVIRTGVKVVPSGLMASSFANHALRARFRVFFSNLVARSDEAFVRAGVARRFRDVVRWITIGAEVDVFLRTSLRRASALNTLRAFHREDTWSNWVVFYDDAGAHVRTVSAASVGCLFTFVGARTLASTDPVTGVVRFGEFFADNEVARASRTSDYVAYTYYLAEGNRVVAPAKLALVFSGAVQIAGGKAVVFQELGCTTFDWKTLREREAAWPGHVFHPGTKDAPGPDAPFYDAEWGDFPIGEVAQREFVTRVVQEWSTWKLRIPLILWFTAFEQHVEGAGCAIHPCWQARLQTLHAADPSTFADPALFDQCDPCMDAACHLCGGELASFLFGSRFGPDWRFGLCGLIRSDGRPKAAWSTLVLLAALLGAQHVPA